MRVIISSFSRIWNMLPDQVWRRILIVSVLVGLYGGIPNVVSDVKRFLSDDISVTLEDVSPPFGQAPLTVSIDAKVHGRLRGDTIYRVQCGTTSGWNEETETSSTEWGYNCEYLTEGRYYLVVLAENDQRKVHATKFIIVTE